MHVADTRARTTTLSPEQREQLRRDGRIARAVEAAQRRAGARFTRTAAKRGRATVKP
jgi:hypothetical protein